MSGKAKPRPVEGILRRLDGLGLEPHVYQPYPSDPGNGRMAGCCLQPLWHDVHDEVVRAAYEARAAERAAAVADVPDITEPRHPHQQLIVGGGD